MAEIASAFVSILPSARGFGRKLESDVSGEVSGTGKRLGSGFGKAFAVAGGAALAGGALLGGFLKGAMDEARDAQVIGARTENVIAKMGNAAGISAEQVGDLAAAISNKTGVDDEAIQAGQNLLLTFGNIRNEAGKGNDIFNQTSRLMVDMSAAMGTDAKGSAVQLGKALNDPVKGLTALSRVGVSFTAQQQDQIKALVATGDTMSAQKVILGELERQFGGAAAAMTTPAEKAAVAWGNFKEDIGTALLPVVDRLLRSFTAALPKIQAFASTVVSAIGPAINGFIAGIKQGEGAGGAFAAVLVALGSSLASVVGFFNQHRTLLISLAAATTALIVVTQAHAAVLAVQAAGGLAAMIRALPIVVTLTRTWAAVQWLLNAAMTANPIGIVVVAIGALVAGLVYAYKNSETFRNVVNAAFNAVKNVAQVAFKAISNAAQATFNWIKSNWKQILAILTGPIGAAAVLIISNWSKIRAATQAAWNAVKSAVAGAVASVVGAVARAIGAVQNFGSALSAGVQAAAKWAAGVIAKGAQVVGWFTALPGKIMATLSGLASRLYSAGSEMMSMLAQGIKDKIGDAYAALKEGAGKLAALIPGSPVKEGPLKSLNKGHAGGEMMKMLAKGIDDNAAKPADAMKKAMEKAHAELVSKRDDITSVLDGLKNDFQSLSDSIASTFTGNLFEPTGTQDFLLNLLDTRGRLNELKAAFKKLLGWGLSPQFLSQLFSSGNGALILDMAGGSRGAALTSAQLFGEVNSLASSLGSSVAGADIGPDIRRQTQVLERMERALDRLPKDFGRELNNTAAGAARGR